MIKKALIETIQRSLLQIDKTARYHDKLVEAYITMASNTILGELFRKDSSGYDLYAKSYIADVDYDSDSDQFYSPYPAPIVQTIDPANGVRSINTLDGIGLEFAPAKAEEMSLFSDVIASKLTMVIPYIPERGRVLYIGEPLDEDYQAIESVRMRLVAPFSEYAMDEFFHIPGGSDLHLIDTVIQIMGRIPPKDLLNNEKDTQWTQ